MPVKKQSYHLYSLEELRHLDGIPLPPKIKCDRCHKWRPQNTFSHKQLTDARQAIDKRGVNATYRIKCKTCSGAQIVELECMMCHKTKATQEFAKAQRSKGDTAKCMECMEEQLAREPVDEDAYENPQGAFQPLDHSNGNYPEYWTASTNTSTTSQSGFEDDDDDKSFGGVALNNKFRGMSVNNTLIDSDYGSGSYQAGMGGPVENSDDGFTEVKAKTKSWHSSNANTSKSSFNPNKYGNPVQASSAAGSSKTFPSTDTEPSVKGGWAKIKAYKAPNPVNRGPSFGPTEPAFLAKEDDWSSGDEDEEGDDNDSDGSDVVI
ncbi:hypothetical protein EJ04DRAFT_591783 [Polyplosphaeria fusca]|uniref:Stc1 domain-containing protein n=1 Tax=Polyplosphaeria fusca TaxID=682080 RepID=A0A9P4R659_9PLEO|nr:hypothetical protein EJ04DRAFT_591783 [Polyplosphaeria fusca]